MSTSSRTAWSTMAACALLMAAGCGSSATRSDANSVPESSQAGSTAPTSSGDVTPSVSPSGAGAGSGSASGTATAVPSVVAPPSPVRTTVAPPTSASGCLSGTVSVVYPASSNPLRSACVHLGTAVNIELMAIRGTTWTAVTPSDPTIAGVTDQVTDGGTRHDSVKLLRPGTVVLSSTSSYQPDPHGPASQEYTLTLTVVP